MGKANVPGIYGFTKGKVGAVVYSTSNAALDGGRKQVIRLKAESVKNPNTVAQIVQRMKVNPASLFFKAFEQAATSIEDNPLSHSFQGYEYGSKNRLRFMQLAMAGEPKAYVPKGVDFAVPGEYQVSEGNLQSLPWRAQVTSETPGVGLLVDFGGNGMTEEQVATLANYGVQVGDQITCLAMIEKNGRYEAKFSRIIVGIGNVSSDKYLDVSVYTNGVEMVNFEDGEITAPIAAAAIIVSRGVASGSAQRSTETMLLRDDYKSLKSVAAFNAAIESYQKNIIYNSLNSSWYLNQGNTQSFNGTVFTQILSLPAGAGVDAFTGPFILGRSIDGGSLVVSIFTSDGTTNGTCYIADDLVPETTAAFTYARIVAALGDVQVKPVKFEQKYYDQLRGL